MPIGTLLVVALMLVTSVAPVAAYVRIDSNGRTGAWAVQDNSSGASLRCNYQADDLVQLTISPPQVFARALVARRVSWQFEIWRNEWWRSGAFHWRLAQSSAIFKASATRSTAAPFAARQWAVPADWRTGYDSIKVRLVMRWYGADQRTQVGHTTVQLQFYSGEYDAQPYDATPLRGHCAGSLRAPTGPPAGTTADPPAGIVRMSHWRPYWQKFSEANVQANIDDLTRMHQTGVILTGMESGGSYSLPRDVAHYLAMFRDAGIKPYMSVWVGRFSRYELRTVVRAWEAGQGRWQGIVIDVERGLELYAESHRAAAVKAMTGFIARLRELSPFIAYSTYGIPSDHRHIPYSELNALTDVFMPQLYFRTDNDALRMLDRMQASVDFESANWSVAPKPIVPVVNDWGDDVDLVELGEYISISLARYGAISGWRLHPNMHPEVEDLWASFDPTP